jgi:hypothetical protein
MFEAGFRGSENLLQMGASMATAVTQTVLQPPSVGKITPLTFAESSDNSHSNARVTTSGSTIGVAVVRAAAVRSWAYSDRNAMSIPVCTPPGATALALTPSGP